jgi:hypothetical protein
LRLHSKRYLENFANKEQPDKLALQLFDLSKAGGAALCVYGCFEAISGGSQASMTSIQKLYKWPSVEKT